MNNNKGYDFFSQSSKLILFIPLALLAVLIMLKWGQAGSPQVQTQSLQRQQARITPSIPPLSMNGPLICNTTVNGATVSAYIKDKMVAATMSAAAKTERILVKGDCAYMWAPQAKTGTKICGLGTVLSLADFLLSRGLLTPDVLFSATGMSDNIAKGFDPKAAIQSCRKQELPQTDAFDLPKGVVFTVKVTK